MSYSYHKKDALSFIRVNKKNFRNKKEYDFGIELKSEKKRIGVTSLKIGHEDKKKADRGSWINKKYWRKGYITEAKVPILDSLLGDLSLEKSKARPSLIT